MDVSTWQNERGKASVTLLAVFGLLLLIGTAPGARGATAGLVIYKDNSFDQDSQAEIATYSHVDHFTAVDNVVTTTGGTLRLNQGQEPIYFPPPGDPDGTAEGAIRTILAAERRFPQFVTKLEILRRAWVSLPRAAAPVAAEATIPAPAPASANVLRTRSGEVFQSWSVSSIDGETVTISHSDGISRIPVTDLPLAVLESNAELNRAWMAAQDKLKASAAAAASASTPASSSLSAAIPPPSPSAGRNAVDIPGFHAPPAPTPSASSAMAFAPVPANSALSGETSTPISFPGGDTDDIPGLRALPVPISTADTTAANGTEVEKREREIADPLTGKSLSVTEFSIPTPESFPLRIAAGPDGNLWFTENDGSKIGRITTTGLIKEFPLPPHHQPSGITGGPDGNVWFTESDNVGKITPAGVITEFPVSGGFGITKGPDGNIWVCGDNITRITPTGVKTVFPLPLGKGFAKVIATGSDGNLWFTDGINDKVGKITPTGAITEFPVPIAMGHPEAITPGPDGNLWFTEGISRKIGRITTSGVITEFQTPNHETSQFGPVPCSPDEIATGPDGNLWFTEFNSSGLLRIENITPNGSFTEYSTSTDPDPWRSSIGLLGIVIGPDGNIWCTGGFNKIIRITVTGGRDN